MRNLKNLGKTLNKTEQKNVFGGGKPLAIVPDLCGGCPYDAENDCCVNNNPNPFAVCGTTGMIGTGASPDICRP